MTELVPTACPRPGSLVQPEIGSVDGFPFQLGQPDNTDYLLAYDWPFGGWIAELRITASLGIGVVSLYVNGQVVTGIDHVPIAAGSRSRHTAIGFNHFLPGDDIFLRVESGAFSLLNVKGTLVISNKSVFGLLDVPVDPRLIMGEIPISGSIESVMTIPLVISPKLLRNPMMIFNGVFVKTDPLQNDITVSSITPFVPGDFLSGWNYNLSAPSVPGQILRYAFIK